MKRKALLAGATLVLGFSVLGGGTLAAPPDLSVIGQFAAPIEEPGPKCATGKDNVQFCKPVAATLVTLADGRLLYWNALEGTENVVAYAVIEGAAVILNDQSRVLDLGGGAPRWRSPSPVDGGANPNGYPDNYLVAPLGAHPGSAYGDLFCTDQVHLSDGSILAAGGTSYYNDPGIPGTNMGIVELEGLRNTRIFHPNTMKWTQSGMMNQGRWYPSLVTLPDGKVFVASGVKKLIKPLYPSQAPTDSGRNVLETETYDPATGQWTDNGAGAHYSLPLFARLHLLPNGHVFYDAAGQTFNPEGQAYDELLWNLNASYDPASKSWTQLGVPGVGTTFPGFRGSAFSVMLPMTKPYTSASFLSAGGVAGVSPGTYVATATSEINTVDTTKGDAVTTRATGPLNNARWYPTGVALPDGTVLAFSGSTSDEVVATSMGMPVTEAEQFDPATNTWTRLASAGHGRTYHNTAVLLNDGRVIVGGHAPIPTGPYPLYLNDTTIPGGFSSAQRDPSFEIYSPPYLFRGPRPVIDGVDNSIGYGGTIRIHTPQAANIKSVALMRNSALTHLVDGDQRTLMLPVVSRQGDELVVEAPPSGLVAPPGPYRLFINAGSPKGLIPSVAQQVFVGVPAPAFVTAANAKRGPMADMPGRVTSGAVGSAQAFLPGTSSGQPAPGPQGSLLVLAAAGVGVGAAFRRRRRHRPSSD